MSTYWAREQSAADAITVELFDFALGGTHWRYTSYPEEVSYSGNPYESVPCRRNEIEQSDDPSRGKIEITLPRDNTLAALYVAGAPEGEVTCTIYRGHDGDFIIYFQGIVEGCKFDRDWIPALIVGPRLASQAVAGKRRKYLRMCDRLLYDEGCELDQNDYDITGNIDAINGTTITASEFGEKSSGWFVAGKFVCGGGTRLIKYHVGSVIKIDRIIAGIGVGSSFVAYAGCDGSPSVCKSKFNNKLNYGGCEFLPTKNPFSSIGRLV